MPAIDIDKLPGTQTVKLATGAAADAAHIVFGTGANLAWIEVSALRGHRADLATRFSLARSANDVFELIDNQLDLMHETRRRLANDRARRREAVERMRKNLTCVSQRLQRPPFGSEYA